MNTPNYPGNYQEAYNPQFEDDSIDFKRYLSLFVTNWYWFAGALFIALIIAYGINRYSEETYTVSATLLINDDQFGGGTEMNIFPKANALRSKQNLKNELGILKSFSLNYRVMQELPSFHVVYVSVGRRGIIESRMYNNLPFKVNYESIEKQRMGVYLNISIISSEKYRLEIEGIDGFSKDLSFGERFKDKGFDFSINLSNSSLKVYDPTASNKYYFYFVSPAGLANQYRSKLNITPIEEEATLVTLSTSGFVPEMEADYLNKLMEIYMLQGLESKNETAEKTIKFIDEQIGSISDSLRIAENHMENFRLSNRLIDLSREGSLIQNRLEGFQNERSTLILQKKYYGYLQEYLNTKNETGDIVSPGAMGVTNASLVSLVEDLAVLQQQKNRLKVNISGDQPAVTLIDNSIKDTKALLLENIISSKKNLDYALQEVDDRISKVEVEINKLPGTEIKLINIQRKFDLNNTVYTYLLEKKAEAGIARASVVSDNKIIDRADLFNSAMIKPKPKQNYAMAIALGLLIPVLLILFIDYFNNKIIDKKDVEKGTEAPILGYISHNPYKSEMPVNEKPGSTLSESFRSVRSNLKYFFKDNEIPVIAISSTISGEGKTFISMNLANIIAMLGKRVLVVGLDLRKPRIHKILDLENGIGMSTYLSGTHSYSEIIQPTEIENLFYAPAGPVPPNPAELIETVRMKEFIDKARKEFDYIIIDTPPIAIVTDALLISSYVDMYILVVRQRYTSKNTLDLIQEFYKKGTLKSLGIVINDISLTGYYGYGLRYGYSIGYGYSYGYNYYNQNVYGKYGYSDKAKGYYSED
jgi:tyrosine-protein kinase Etk/Wzc